MLNRHWICSAIYTKIHSSTLLFLQICRLGMNGIYFLSSFLSFRIILWRQTCIRQHWKFQSSKVHLSWLKRNWRTMRHRFVPWVFPKDIDIYGLRVCKWEIAFTSFIVSILSSLFIVYSFCILFRLSSPLCVQLC